MKTRDFGLIAYIEIVNDSTAEPIGHAWATKRRARFIPNEGVSIDHAAHAVLHIVQKYNIPVTMRFNSVKVKVPNNKQLTVQKIKDEYFDLSR